MSRNTSNKEETGKVEKSALPHSSKLNPTEVRDCIRNYFTTQSAVKRAWLFGSFARGDQDENSDVDILIDVDMDAHITLFDLAEYQEVLQKTLNRKVDFAMIGALRDAFRKNIADDLVLVHEA